MTNEHDHAIAHPPFVLLPRVLLRKDVQEQEWSEPRLHVTISGGVAEYSGGEAEQLIRRADSLMYQAKQMGRNRIVSETTMNRRSSAETG